MILGMFKNGKIVTTSGQKNSKIEDNGAFRQLEFHALCLTQTIQKKGFVE